MKTQRDRTYIKPTSTTGTVADYMPGFGNDYETEALPDIQQHLTTILMLLWI